jgi:putative hydrolase of the HAD superfamily
LAQLSAYTPEQIYEAGLKTHLVQDYEMGRLCSREFQRAICRKLKMDIEYPDFAQMWNDIFSENKQVSELIRALSKNYRLFLLSNTNELHFDFARKNFPLLDEFEEYILSYCLGCTKPDPRIFQEAIRRAGCKPGEIVYIDDIAEYVAAAESLGIQGIHFHSSRQLKDELSQRQVSWGRRRL